jgi:methionyl-tRNA synthetase
MTGHEKFYITTAIPYVNGDPHMGHALEYIQTDVSARYHRLVGRDVFFLTGTDDNSLKNVQAAENEGITTTELVERNTAVFVWLCKGLNLSNSSFIRTMQDGHFRGVRKLWSASNPEDIYKKTYEGLYCVGCEAFYKGSELVDGKCPEHRVEPDQVREENYFFRLSSYQQQLEDLIESDTYRIIPEFRKNEVLSFIRSGLQDFSISRSQARAKGWGIPVPGDEDQVIYVWYDALGNYITGIGYGQDEDSGDTAGYRNWWPCNVHCIGKGIIRFHAVYWPAMLLSAGLPLPKQLFVHGYITINGQKMAKSLGTIVDPFSQVEEYGAETIRFYMTKHISPFQDGDYNTSNLEEAYTADLANGIGNLLSRSLTMVEKHGKGEVQPRPCTGPEESAIVRTFERIFSDYDRLMPEFEFSQAMMKIWEGVASLDRYINEKAPWKMAKEEGREEDLATVLYILCEGLRMIASLVSPVMPNTAAEIWRRLGLDKNVTDIPWTEQRQWGLLQAGLKVDKGQPLFPRLDR